jgi:hypothetical protein
VWVYQVSVPSECIKWVYHVSMKKYNLTVHQMTQVRFFLMLLSSGFPSVTYTTEMHYKCPYVTNLPTFLWVISKHVRCVMWNSTLNYHVPNKKELPMNFAIELLYAIVTHNKLSSTYCLFATGFINQSTAIFRDKYL